MIQGGHPIFRAHEIEAWASQRILGLQDGRLTEYYRQTTQGTRQVASQEALLPELIQPEFIAPRMTAKTKASIVRDMVALADRTGRLNDPKEFIESLEATGAFTSPLSREEHVTEDGQLAATLEAGYAAPTAVANVPSPAAEGPR